MKKEFSFILIVLSFISSIYANDAWFNLTGGSLMPTVDDDISVQMESETINIIMYEEFYEILVDFNFYNHSKTVSLNVGFPFLMKYDGEGKIYDFKCWTNDKETDYSDYPIDIEWRREQDKNYKLENAFVRKIEFPQKDYTRTRIYYKCSYGKYIPYLVSYLYGTGASWNGKIKKITVNLENNMTYFRPDINNEWKRKGDNKWQLVKKNIKPNYLDTINIQVQPFDYDASVYEFPHGFDFNKKIMWPNNVRYNQLTSNQMQLSRNTIYALHGYHFQKGDLRNYFESQYWYKMDPNYKQNKLSLIENINVKILLYKEKKLKKKYIN